MRFTFAPHETARLRRAAERAKKLGDTAAKACQKAEVDDAAAAELSGYAEEADLFLQKATAEGTDLGARHCMALATGIRAILADLEKDREEQSGLFVDVDNLDDGMHNYRALLTKVRGGGNAPELELRAAAEDFRRGIPVGGSVTIEAAGHDPVTITREK